MEELSLGFNGLLTISENMEQLIDSIALDKVPKSWVDLAYPSKRGLASWFQNLLKRIEQLRNWKDDSNVIPKVTMLNRLFNSQSFLTIKGLSKSSVEEIDGSLTRLRSKPTL